MKACGFSTLFYHVQVLGGERDVLIWIKQLWKSPRIQNHMINLIALHPQQNPQPSCLKQARRVEFQKELLWWIRMIYSIFLYHKFIFYLYVVTTYILKHGCV